MRAQIVIFADDQHNRHHQLGGIGQQIILQPIGHMRPSQAVRDSGLGSAFAYVPT